ncbi:MAG: hypothetical protein WAW06_02520 [bacterium]
MLRGLAGPACLIAMLVWSAPAPGCAQDRQPYPQAEAASGGGETLRPLNRAWNPGEGASLRQGDHRLGASLRLRYYDYRNVYGLGAEPDPSAQTVAARIRISLDWRRTAAWRLFAQVASESDLRLDCGSCEDGVGEIIFESLYAENVRPWGLPLAVRLGRQDLFYGEGFLVADGGPLDQSRTTYANAVVITSQIPLWSIDALVLYDPRSDIYLPRINNKRVALVENDEFAIGVFASRRPSPGTALRYGFDPYYIFKKESANGRVARIHTVGTVVSANLGRARAALEVAYQGGRAPEIEYPGAAEQGLSGPLTVSAVGGHATAQTRLGLPLPLDFAAGYVFLSGDASRTRNKFEGWNPVLGRVPIISDLYIFTLAAEAPGHPMNQGLAYWQNLSMPFFKIGFDRGGSVAAEIRYCRLDAFEDLPTAEKLATPQLEGPKHRGDLVAARLSFNLPWRLAGNAVYEIFRPGDFYPAILTGSGFTEPRDATYFRLEISRSL